MAASIRLLNMTLPFTKRCVLLTGAGGSIGSALAYEIIQHRPRSLILFDHSEGNLHQIDHQLGGVPGGAARSAVLGDVGDEALLTELFEERKPDIVIHAAAYKHVPLMEWNPLAAVRNNALGTNLLAKLARNHQIAGLLMVSTDKAVNPHSVMGASKRVAELALLRWSTPESPMKVVRLGNVVGTRGSVVPLFQQQIAAGGPVTVTHPEASRFFLSMSRAVELILLAGSSDVPVGIYIPDHGTPLRIADLAQRLVSEVELSAKPSIPIVMTGLRPGEKMSEEFVSGRESIQMVLPIRSNDAARLCLINSPHPAKAEFDETMAKLQESVQLRDVSTMLDVLKRLVPEYQPSEVVLESRRKEPQSTPL
jgi:FlaA1/EpsC-like NDP-sugar epimerase